MDRRFTGLEEGFKARDCRHELHSIVGRAGIALRHLFTKLPEDQDGAVTTRPRISFGGTVGVDLDMLGAFRVGHPSL